MGRSQARCFVCTRDRPFLLSKVAGNFTIHDCSIEEAEIMVRDGVAADLYRLKIPARIPLEELEASLYGSLLQILKGRINLEREIYLWEREHQVIRDRITSSFQSVQDNRAVLSVETSNTTGLLHKISWTLSLAGLNIERALFSALDDHKGEDIFWISQRQGQAIEPEYQAQVLDLLNLVVGEGRDPIEQEFKKTINMIYRQQLRRRGGGFTTAQLYADAHLKLIEDLFVRVKAELNLEDRPVLTGVFGGIGSGAIGFTSDIDLVFLHDGEWTEEYQHLQSIFTRRLIRVSSLEADETFLQYHINYFYLNRPEGERIVSFDDFFGYLAHIRRMRRDSGRRLFMPQFFHFPWAFSLRLVGSAETMELFQNRVRNLPRSRKRAYKSIKSYILGEMREEIRGDYLEYLRGGFFRHELAFLDPSGLRKLYREREYDRFIETIAPYDAVKYIFRRGAFPLLHIIHHQRHRTDQGLLRREYRHIRAALDFMLKAFNVRKTLLIMGWWDVDYFLYIMNCKTKRRFCEAYLKHQQDLIDFTREVAGTGEP